MSSSSRSDTRNQILQRRARFVAAALASAGLVGGAGCKEPQPCLSIAPVTTANEEPGATGETTSVEETTTGSADTSTAADSTAAEDGKADAGSEPPRVCLKVAPPSDSAPRPCLSMSRPCLSPPAPNKDR